MTCRTPLTAIAAVVIATGSTAGAEDLSAGKTPRVPSCEGGLVVHVRCGDGTVTAELCGSNVVVHGLDMDTAHVEKTRALLRGKKIYGRASAAQSDGKRLPYADEVVNLLVIEQRYGLTDAEVMRVLVPGGAAYAKRRGKWAVTRKPPTKGTDDWTHYLYDASNNAVSKDTAVGPPASLRWVTAPKFSRSHEHLASLSAAVSAGGRVFSIEDHGPIESVAFPPQWFLVARDAYNGVTLWTCEMGPWEWHLREFRHGPPQITRRLVAVGDRVYVTLSYGGPGGVRSSWQCPQVTGPRRWSLICRPSRCSTVWRPLEDASTCR